MYPIARLADRVRGNSVRQLVSTPGDSWWTAATTAMTLLLVAGTVLQPVAASQDESDRIDIEYEGDGIRLEAAPNQTITGTTDFEPGTKLRVRVQSHEVPFLKSRRTSVSSDGSFEISFDLSEVDAPSNVTVTVSTTDGAVSEQVSGRLVAPGTELADEQVEVPTMTTVEQGEAANLTVTMPAGESVVVEIGDEAETGYSLVVLVEDADGDGEVTLRFDTAAAGTDDPTVGVGDGDRFEIADPEPRLNDSLDVGNYDLTAATTIGGDPVSLGTLVINDGSAAETATDRTNDSRASATSNGDFWSRTAPGIAGVIALVAGLGSLALYRK